MQAGSSREMATPHRANAVIDRVRRTLDRAISNENYYLAYKLYKSLFHRYTNIPNIEAALRTLYEGVLFLLDKQQVRCATNLSQEFAKTLLQKRVEPCEQFFDYIKEMFNKFGPARASDRKLMLKTVFKWSIAMCPEFPHGHPNLHEHIGLIYLSESNYSSAKYHYLRSSDGVGFANMLVKLHTTGGFKQEIDLLITQIVLQALCLHNKIIARSTFLAYTILHPDINNDAPYKLPLLNFVYFLLEIIEKYRCSLRPYVVICEHYQLALIRDPCFVVYLDTIAQKYFGVGPTPGPGPDPLDF